MVDYVNLDGRIILATDLSPKDLSDTKKGLQPAYQFIPNPLNLSFEEIQRQNSFRPLDRINQNIEAEKLRLEVEQRKAEINVINDFPPQISGPITTIPQINANAVVTESPTITLNKSINLVTEKVKSVWNNKNKIIAGIALAKLGGLF